MNADLLKRKYQAEVDAYPKNIGLFKRYSFLLRLSGDHLTVRSLLLQDNFSKTEITNTKSKINHYIKKKNHALVADRAF
ncbi:MAG TPA: hypothetical protein PLP48_09005 [Acholeplasmataceae bacterium]|nr:hypothetical protein [Acholeplasmataceae bacterium]